MARESARLPDWQSDGLVNLAANFDSLTKTELIQRGVARILGEYEDEIPDHVRRESAHSEIVRENKPHIREMMFKNNVEKFLREELLDSYHPPEPAKVTATYFESLRRQVRSEFGEEYQEEYLSFVDEKEGWYSSQWHDYHDDSGTMDKEEDYAAVVRQAAIHCKHERVDMAVKFIEKADDDGRLPDGITREEAVEDARSKAGNDGWMDDWSNAVNGGKV